MPNLFVTVGTVGIVAALMGVIGVAALAANHERRIRNLEQHGRTHRATVQITESLTDTLLKLAEDEQVMRARLDNVLLKVDFIRSGGNPEAPWSEIMRWHGQRDGKK